MYLRSTTRKKDGKQHRYFSVVESHRLSTGKTVQRPVLYLGEINDKQEAAWRKSVSAFDADRQQYTTLSLFPEDRIVPDDALNGIQVRLSGLELRNPRGVRQLLAGVPAVAAVGAGGVLAKTFA